MNLHTPGPYETEQKESRKRLNAKFRTPCFEPVAEPKYRTYRPKPIFIENPHAPRCAWPRPDRDWLLIVLEGGRPPPTIKEILSAVSTYYDIPTIDILSHRRTANVVIPRQVTMYLARKLTTASLPKIARQIGGRDHTTAMAAVRRIDGYLETKPEVAAAVAHLSAILSGGENETAPDFAREVESLREMVEGR